MPTLCSPWDRAGPPPAGAGGSSPSSDFRVCIPGFKDVFSHHLSLPPTLTCSKRSLQRPRKAPPPRRCLPASLTSRPGFLTSLTPFLGPTWHCHSPLCSFAGLLAACRPLQGRKLNLLFVAPQNGADLLKHLVDRIHPLGRLFTGGGLWGPPSAWFGESRLPPSWAFG